MSQNVLEHSRTFSKGGSFSTWDHMGHIDPTYDSICLSENVSLSSVKVSSCEIGGERAEVFDQFYHRHLVEIFV